MKHLLLVLALCGCPKPAPPAPVPPRAADAGPATCAEVCDRLRELSCIDGPTPEGARCEEVCGNIMDSGFLVWDLDCRARAVSCDEIEACEES